MEDNYSFGYWIRRRRKALDLTQEHLAQRVACTLSMIKKIELDQRRPSRLMAERLADGLQIPTFEREAFIKVALAYHASDRLSLESEPLETEALTKNLTNLPIPATQMFGRGKQVAQIVGLLQKSNIRMLSLTGPGGVGKTRLANHIATYLYPDFADGAWQVELASLTNAALVPQLVATSLGIHEASGKSSAEILANYLREKRLLLLLDNCEHLLDACARLAHALLSACSGLVVVCTTREALNIPEEVNWLVPPLDLPDLNTVRSIDELAQNAAVSLFIDRAQHVQPSFTLTEQNSLAVAKLCCRLDGLPLAIELAAGRVVVLSPNQIEGKLDDAIRWLNNGFRTADERQQTMHSAIEWSFNSLSEPEQALLRRLSVFTGGWTLESAEAVCSTKREIKETEVNLDYLVLQADDILDLLNKLVNKSMVTTVQKQGQELRYNLLETIHQYAGDKLAAAGEEDAVRQRHLDYYLAWVESVAPALHGPEQVAWLKILDLELENLRLALAWGIQSEPVAGLRLASGLYRYWRVRNLYLEGENWLLQFLDFPENKMPTIHRAFALGVLCSLGIFRAPSPEVWAIESLEISEALHDEERRAFALWMLGSIYYLRYEDFTQGQHYLTKSMEAYEAIGDPWGMAQVLFHLANLAVYHGDSLTQRTYLVQSLILYRQIGDIHGIASALDTLASVVADIDADLETGRRLVEEALGIYRQLDTKSSKHNALYVYAYILAWMGDYQLAGQVLQERLEIIRQTGEPLNIVLAEVLIAGVDRLAGKEKQAQAVLEKSLKTMRASDPRLVQVWHCSRTIHELAYILARCGDTQRARELLQEALEKCDVAEERAILFHCMGSVAVCEQHATEALEYFLQSLKICREGYFKLTAILAVEGIAEAECLLAEFKQATRLLSAADAFRKQVGAPVSPWDQLTINSMMIVLSNQLGGDGFAENWAVGQAQAFDQAIVEAAEIRPVE